MEFGLPKYPGEETLAHFCSPKVITTNFPTRVLSKKIEGLPDFLITDRPNPEKPIH